MAKTELPHHHGEEKMNTAEIREVLERVDNFQTIADVFRQLGDTTRVRIFWLLCHCEECVIAASCPRRCAGGVNALRSSLFRLSFWALRARPYPVWKFVSPKRKSRALAP